MPLRRTTIAWSTCVFLVLLRLTIGWHFLVEGYEKVVSVATGPTDSVAGTSKPWTSAGYLREANGPLAEFFRWQAGGDPDELALAKFDVRPVPEGEDPARVQDADRIPTALDQDWDDYFQRFVEHYGLDARQKEVAEARLRQSKARAVRWLLGKEGVTEIEKNDIPTATYKVKETPRERINEYRGKLDEIARIENQEMPAFGKDVYKQNLRTLKSDAARLRTELLADLDRPMIEDLQGVLTPEQKARGPVPAPPPPPVLAWTDFFVRWGLVVVGLCLLAGLLTRPAAFAGAVFLVMLYLAMPPFPWLPENLRVEGHYLFVNKNLIEALALLALATVPSGRWFGLDALLQFLNPWRWRAAPPVNRGVPPYRTSEASVRA